MWLADARAFSRRTSKASERCPGDEVAASPLPHVPNPCVPSCPHIIFVLFLSPVLPPVSALPPCHSLPCPLFCVCYFNYPSHLLHSLCFLFTLCPSLQAFFPFFSLLGNPLLWSKHQGRVVQSRVKITQCWCKILIQIWKLKKHFSCNSFCLQVDDWKL